MADLKKAGWYLAFGNFAVFAVAGAVTLTFGGASAPLLLG